jgi:uncharacterized protein (TIGR00369 family)
MDPVIAREAFETALAEQSPGFGTFFLARLLELDITYGEDSCRIAFPVRSHFFNPGGTLHGGIIATVMDISMGHLLRHVSGAGGATLQMNIQYLRPLTEGRATCEGRVLRRGRTVAYLESRLSDAEGRLAAIATSTWQPREPDADARR